MPPDARRDDAAQREPSRASHGWLANFGAQALSLVSSLLERLIVVGLLLRGWGPDVYAGWTVLLSAAGALSLADLGMALYFGNLCRRRRRAARPRSCSARSASRSSSISRSPRSSPLPAPSRSSSTPPATLAAGRIDARGGDDHSRSARRGHLLRVARGGLAQIYRGHRQFARGILIDLVVPLRRVGGGNRDGARGREPDDARRALSAVRDRRWERGSCAGMCVVAFRR